MAASDQTLTRPRRGKISTISVIFLLLATGCTRSDPEAVADEGGRRSGPSTLNENCLTRDQEAQLRKGVVTATAAKRLARHYGACIYDADAAVAWLQVAVDQGDHEAMIELASLLEMGGGPSKAKEAAALRRRAASSADGEVGAVNRQ